MKSGLHNVPHGQPWTSLRHFADEEDWTGVGERRGNLFLKWSISAGILVKCDRCDFLDELTNLFGRCKKKSLSLFTGPLKVDVKFK